MSKVIMIGCDLHDATMALRIADGVGDSVRMTHPTAQRARLIARLKELADARGASRIVFVYEASGQGFGLYDDLVAAGIECHVLAPTRLAQSVSSRKTKTDDKDAERLLDEVRAFVLAGRPLPAVWVPDRQARDDREAVRLRLELAAQRTRIKNQIKNLLKRNQTPLPERFTASGNWSKKSVQWLHEAAIRPSGGLGAGARAALGSLTALYEGLTAQIQVLDDVIERLSQGARHRQAHRKLKTLSGVGTLTAMVFLTELGNLSRFKNRRELSAYLGLAPSCHESGERNDRKGRITRQGPARVRHVLCQASWAALRLSPEWRATYERIRRGSKSRSKIALVAVMRQLGVTMWHTARSQELDRLLEESDRLAASAPAPRKRGRPPASPSPRPRQGEAEARATRTGRKVPLQ
jgi:transposase